MFRWLGKMYEKLDVAFTRGPAVMRHIGVKMSDVPLKQRGLLIVQIDGLSYERMTDAMAKHQLPFLRKLVRQRKYVPFKYLSEIPTSTPAFQAGMFYGDNDNIPGFGFYDKKAKRLFRMGRSECAHCIEGSFTKPGLLRGGSVLSCVYTGGADESLFVFSSLLAPQRWRFVLRAWDVFLLTLLNLILLFKVFLLILLELCLAIVDSFKWIVTRGWVARELQIIGIRIGLTIFTRELITIGAVVDMYRRMPVIYLNFLGYDEQAHLRGPDSPVARWTLRGIDKSIRRIYKAKLLAEREYDLFILSDHGQCECMPFEMLENETLAETLQAHLAGLMVDHYSFRDRPSGQMLHTVEGMRQLAHTMPHIFRPFMRMYANHLHKRIRQQAEIGNAEALLDVSVISSGPVAYIYWNQIERALTAEEIEELHPGLLETLASNPSVGCISTRTENGDVLIQSQNGYALLGEQTVRSHGTLPLSDSTDRDHVLRGIRRVTMFQRSGDICVWGGGSSKGHVSYSFEFGAHSGWTDDEISSFVLSPVHVDFDFSTIRRHAEFYDFFSGRYRHDIAVEEAKTEEPELAAQV